MGVREEARRFGGWNTSVELHCIERTRAGVLQRVFELQTVAIQLDFDVNEKALRLEPGVAPELGIASPGLVVIAKSRREYHLEQSEVF